ncbi:transposase [Lysinibacillus sphaericus]|uniref:transposase n=1 Tax=Lysinibacillus sphaericus TaxID=1421 RepID=UPI003D012AB2
MDRQRIYFSLANQTYYTNPYGGQWNFELDVDRQALDVFEKIFQQMQLLEISNAWRAQLPYVPYHLDQENDAIDLRLKKIYALVHEYGDADTKAFVEQLPYFNRRV